MKYHWDILRSRAATTSALGEVVAEIEYPFSVPLMDASFDYCEKVITEVKDYCEREFKIRPQEVIWFSCYRSLVCSPICHMHFQSHTRLTLVQASEREECRYVAILFLSAESERK